jgi:autotransporter-associated beta strand protein
MNPRRFLRACGFLAVLGSATLGLRAQVVTYVWSGTSDGFSWDASGNWVGGVVPPDDLVNARVILGASAAPEIQFFEFFLNQLRIEGLKRSLELWGAYETANLGSGGLIYAPAQPVLSVLSDAVKLRANQTWDIQSGTFIVAGSLSDFFFNGETSTQGMFSLTKTGTGTLVLESPYSGSWTGGLILSAGRVELYNHRDFWGTALSQALGTGPLVFNGGTLVARYHPDSYYGEGALLLGVPIVSNGLISTVNQAELAFQQPGESNAKLQLAADTTIVSQGKSLVFDLPIIETGGARKLTVNADNRIFLQGSTSWTGGTEVTKGALIFAGENNVAGAPDSIKVGTAGYVGITIGQNVGGFLTTIDKVNSTGSIGFDTPGTSEPSTVTSPIDLTGFNAAIRLGSATEGILGSTAVITPQGNAYRFGGGGGRLTVQSALTDAAKAVGARGTPPPRALHQHRQQLHRRRLRHPLRSLLRPRRPARHRSPHPRHRGLHRAEQREPD